MRTKRTAYQRMGNDPSFDLRSELYRIAGIDLTDIPGMSAIPAQVVLTEVGPDVRRFRNASAFASWLGLCPDKRISGGKSALHQDGASHGRAGVEGVPKMQAIMGKQPNQYMRTDDSVYWPNAMGWPGS